ncbi:xylulokinase [Effusibacillus lacus]|uniref:Xylulose kinase n=1 Tax=Effusibacillus lacus TaxID=1348429 RepID=A0A292YRY5_9BACL|nr:xylulokinase [Effusibacillus lacus]TCS75921.1 xylulokinase [Effusibacillus lacus]GAX91689.1 xylulokinase [Effusibacillus lacus]
MKYLLGIDLGTSSVKTILVDQEGRMIGSETAGYPLEQPFPGWAEQNPKVWWYATVAALDGLFKKSGVDPRQIEGIGLSGQMHGSVFLDENKQVLRPAILWCDQRTAAECEWIEKNVGPEKWNRWVANRPLTGFTAPKILWVKKHEPEIYRHIRHILLPKDYIRFRLTGELATEVSDASGTLLFDVVRRTWSKEMFDVLDIPADWMPAAHESHFVSSVITSEVADRLGLKKGVPVVGGGGDNAAGAVGTGVVKTGRVLVSLGTSGVVFAHSDQPLVDIENRLHSFCHAVAGKWHTMGVILSAAECLKWWRTNVGQQEEQIAKQSGRSVYDVMCEAADTVPPGSNGLLFLPYLLGERTPYADPDARGAFIGMTLRHDKAAMTRAVLEGVAFALRDSLEIMKQLQIPLSEIRVTGGGAKSKVWRQIIADIMGIEVVSLAVDEGPAYGAALLAGEGAGLYPSVEEACENFIRTEDRILPNPERLQRYDEYYKIYRQMYGVLQNQFHRLSELEKQQY